jgi:ATP-dependent helicase/nuclease subunit A
MTGNNKDETMQKTSDTAKSVHLSASAGSGKTRALKDRYLALLDRLDRGGLGLDQAVAITFTDKAAAEIKERVMHDLPEAMLKKIIRGRQDLRISTIHSFCMNLLKRYPLEAGLPPDFGVLDARDQASKIQQAIEDAIEESDRMPGLMQPLNDFTVDDLVSVTEFLLSIRSRLKRMEIDAGGPDALRQAVTTGLGTGASEQELKTLIGSPEWRAVFLQMELLLRSQGNYYEECNGAAHASLAVARDSQTAYRPAELLLPVYFTQNSGPRKKLFIAKSKYRPDKAFPYSVYETLSSQAQDALSRFRSAYRRARAGHEAVGLLRLFQRAEEKYQNAKLREGLLDFDDLEIYAYRLLQGMESPDILYWLDRKILHFLVDEFQDTSDIQWAILHKLTEEIFSGQGADKPMRPTLFVVGDEKQSIYRFREANYRLIESIRDKMRTNIPHESREVLSLDKNFRSTPEIVKTVNRVFTGLWGESYKPSEADRTTHRGSAALIELLPGLAEEKSSGPTEADILAREIRTLVGKGTSVYERAAEAVPGWKARPAGYGDCAVLIQSRTRLKEYEAALRAWAIPYRVVGGIGFYEEDEIQALINVLFFLWNRDDNLALAAALTSPLFGLTDKDIFTLMQESGNLADALKRGIPGTGRMLENWTGIARLVPLSALVHKIVEETGAYVRFGSRNPQAIFNIEKLLDTAREFDRRGYTTLQDFVEWIKNIRRTEQREATSDMNLPGFQGSVSILTVHKAKGLEYPIVFLPGMNQFARSLTTGPEALVEEAGGTWRMAVKSADNPVYEELWSGGQGEQEELRREHQRLLYVAMTRARDHLIMLGTLASVKAPVRPNTWLDFLHRSLRLSREKNAGAGQAVVKYAHPDWQAQPVAAEGETGQQPAPERPGEAGPDITIVIRNIAPLPLSEAPEWKRVTDFIEQKKEAALEIFSPQTDAGLASPLTRGSVLHRCLEEFTKTGGYELDRIIMEYPDITMLTGDAKRLFLDDIGAVLQSVMARSDFAWIFERREGSYSELPFLYKKGRSLVSGIIDRVVIKGDSGSVVDYKAIRIENDVALKEWSAHYRPQIRIYCEAVKEMFGLSNVEGYLLFLDSNRLEPATKV